MNRTWISLFLFILGVALTIPTPVQAQSSIQQRIAFAKRKVYPALVNISVVNKNFFGGRSQKGVAAGSGVIVSPNGYILTNYHVAQDTVRLFCTLTSGERIRATVTGHDPLTDLTVLKLDLKSRENPNLPLPFATLGDSSKLKVGAYVLAMGNPMSLSSSTTLGIVSNPKRVFTDFLGNDLTRMDLGQGEVTGLFTQWIQHDALILPGNSGGPLVNLDGEVIGINELGGSGVGFAIPSNLCGKVLTQVLTYGKVNRAWSGLTVLPVAKLGRKTGALVSSVSPLSPALKTGLQPGDIILEMNGQKVSLRFFEQVPAFYQQIAELNPTSTMTLKVLRDGKIHSFAVKMAPLEEFLGREAEFRSLGVTVRHITTSMARARRYPNTQGVLVTGVRPGYIADEARLRIRRGDVILAMGGKSIKNLDHFIEMIKNLKSFKELLVQFRRSHRDMLTVFKKPADENRIMGGELEKPWMGIQTQVLTPAVAKALDAKGKRGFRVTRIFPFTKVAQSGLKVGDLIVAVDGKKLRAYRLQDATELKRIIENRLIGEELNLTVIRNGKEQDIKVELEETPQTATQVKSHLEKSLEFSVREVTFMDRIANHWKKDQQGLIVAQVVGGGWASVGGLKGGDLILRVQGHSTNNIKDLKKVLKKVKKNKPQVIKMFVRRGIRTHYVFIEPDWSSQSSSK